MVIWARQERHDAEIAQTRVFLASFSSAAIFAADGGKTVR
jgi:hypothetical protein